MLPPSTEDYDVRIYVSSGKIDGKASDRIDVGSDAKTLEKPSQIYSERKKNKRPVS